MSYFLRWSIGVLIVLGKKNTAFEALGFHLSYNKQICATEQ